MITMVEKMRTASPRLYSEELSVCHIHHYSSSVAIAVIVPIASRGVRQRYDAKGSSLKEIKYPFSGARFHIVKTKNYGGLGFAWLIVSKLMLMAPHAAITIIYSQLGLRRSASYTLTFTG